jgi:MFS family permease
MRTLVLSTFPMGIAFGTYGVAMPAFAEQHGFRAGAGLLIACQAVGSLCGGVWYGARHSPGPLSRRYVVLCSLLAAGLAPLALAGTMGAMAVLMVFSGLAYAPATAVAYELISELAPRGTLTEAYTWSLMAMVSGAAAGAAIAGSVVDAAGWRWALVAAFAAAAAGAGIVVAGRRTLAPAREPAPAA